MSGTATYSVTGMTCSHCVAAVTEEVGALAGVDTVDVDLTVGHLDGESHQCGPVAAGCSTGRDRRGWIRPDRLTWARHRWAAKVRLNVLQGFRTRGSQIQLHNVQWIRRVSAISPSMLQKRERNASMTQQAIDLQIDGMTCAPCAADREEVEPDARG